MKDHHTPWVQDWKNETGDYDLLVTAGVPKNLARVAAAVERRPLPKPAKQWLEHLDYIHHPTMERVREHPSMGGVGLVLYGDSGVGKTVMAIQTMLDIIRSDRDHWIDDSLTSRILVSMLGTYVDWQDLSQMLRERAGGNESEQWLRMQYALTGEPLLGHGHPRNGPFSGGGVVVIDDISRERQTEFNQDRLHSILRKRNSECFLTILTTNFAPDQWADVYGPVLGAYMKRAFVDAEVV
jgi:DNA replication protein DnaC